MGYWIGLDGAISKRRKKTKAEFYTPLVLVHEVNWSWSFVKEEINWVATI